MVASVILNTIAGAVLCLTEHIDEFFKGAILGLIQTVVGHLIWLGFVLLVGKLNKLLKEGVECHTRAGQGSMQMAGLPQTQGMVRDVPAQVQLGVTSHEVENVGYV